MLPAMKGLRSVHIQPPGKHPYPDDQTPEAESVRAQLQPQQPRAGAREGRADGPYAGTGAELEAANPRSVLAQPPGKQPHPDDPAFGQQQEEEQQQQEQREGQASQHAQLHMGHLGGADAEATRPKSVHRQPPGKQPDQIQQIAASAQEVEDLGPQLLRSHAATVKPLAPWRLQQPGPQQVGSQLNVPAPAGSSQQARVLAPPLAPGGSAGMTDNASSRKRPAGHSGEAGQRKKANGAAEGGSASAGPQRQSFAGTPSLVVPSLARPGEALQQIRPMPGAPRSLQQRQQLANGALAGSVGRKSVGASRPKQSGGSSGAAKPKQASTKPGTSGQRKSGGTAGSTAAGAGLPGIPAGSPQFRPGDVVWAKIGNYPWWPAQLQRPSTEDHIKPKHSSSDLFCVFYGEYLSDGMLGRRHRLLPGTLPICAGTCNASLCLQVPMITIGCQPQHSNHSRKSIRVSGEQQFRWQHPCPAVCSAQRE